jgi:hypothetical protein
MMEKPTTQQSCRGYLLSVATRSTIKYAQYAEITGNILRRSKENAKWGEPVWGEIDTAIRHYDKPMVICSKHWLQKGTIEKSCTSSCTGLFASVE